MLRKGKETLLLMNPSLWFRSRRKGKKQGKNRLKEITNEQVEKKKPEL